MKADAMTANDRSEPIARQLRGNRADQQTPQAWTIADTPRRGALR